MQSPVSWNPAPIPRSLRNLETVRGGKAQLPEHSANYAAIPVDMISQRSAGGHPGSGLQLGTGRGTLRLRSRGPATVEDLVSEPPWASDSILVT